MMKTLQGSAPVSFIIPAHNESKLIASTISAVYGMLIEKTENFELIVVDDRSSDNTFEIIAREEKSRPRLKAVRNKVAHGKGAALSEALSLAKGDFIFYSDADLSIGLDIFGAMLLSLSNGADIAVASKHLPSSKVRYPFLRGISSRAFSLLSGLLLGLPVHDTQCGFKGFRRAVVSEIGPRVKDRRWFWDTEFLARAHWAGKSIVEIPATVRAGARDSNLHILPDSLGMGKALFGLFLEKEFGGADG